MMLIRDINNVFVYKNNLQINNGAKFLSANLSQLEIDTTGMSPCILSTAPSDCTNGGATYMFWIKQLSEEKGAILTTLDWSSPREGIRVSAGNNGKLDVAIFREGATHNRFTGSISGFGSHIGSWLHVTIVWCTDPKYEVFFNGVAKSVTQSSDYSSSSTTYAPRMRMRLGVQYITKVNDVKIKSMVIDNMTFYNKPLTQSDIDQMV